MSELKPDVNQMISIAKDCGLTTVGEAYDNYMSHYDCFFNMEKHDEQFAVFIEELHAADCVEKNPEWTETGCGKPRYIVLDNKLLTSFEQD